MALTKAQIAIKIHYRNKKLGLDRRGRPIGSTRFAPRDRMVLDGTVKLTPRRREILWHVAFSDDLKWLVEKDWADRWSGSYRHLPYLGVTAVPTIVRYLLKYRLVRYSKAGPSSYMPVSRHSDVKPILLITPRGMTALLECLKYQLEED